MKTLIIMLFCLLSPTIAWGECTQIQQFLAEDGYYAAHLDGFGYTNDDGFDVVIVGDIDISLSEPAFWHNGCPTGGTATLMWTEGIKGTEYTQDIKVEYNYEAMLSPEDKGVEYLVLVKGESRIVLCLLDYEKPFRLKEPIDIFIEFIRDAP